MKRTNRQHWSRREFFHGAALGLGTLALTNGPLALRAADPLTADQIIPGKDRRLIVYASDPAEIETPLDLLRAQDLTPRELLFVRNNQQLPGALSLKPIPLADWTIELAGLVEFPRVVTGRQLAELPRVEEVVVLQCSGNGRQLFNAAAPVKGSPWSRGAMGNVKFSGVPLAALLDAAKCQVDPRAEFLTAEGKDSPTSDAKADFEHSIPLADALAKSFLATEMNGEPIPAVHGGPVRLITPGYYGTMHVKWLSRLRFEAEETYNHNQVKRYRTPLAPIEPGSKFDYARANSEPNWRMRVKSVIFSPLAGQKIARGDAEVFGVAFNDGAAKIETVLFSSDNGATWRTAKLEKSAGPYAWHWWRGNVSLAAGRQTILARAIDAFGRTQPLDIATQWNPDGYAFSGVDRVSVDVT